MFSAEFLEKFLNTLCFVIFKQESDNTTDTIVESKGESNNNVNEDNPELLLSLSLIKERIASVNITVPNTKYTCIYFNEHYNNIYPNSIIGNDIEHYIKLPNELFINNNIGELYTKLYTNNNNKKVIVISLKLGEYLTFGLLFPELCLEITDEINKSKTDFISNISHEFRTPLNGIIGMTQIIKETTLTKEQSFCISNIEKCNYDLLSLINDILDYSKLDNGSLELDIKSFSIKDCIEGALNINLLKIKETSVKVEYKINKDVPLFILGDKKRLKQVLINLLNNSLKFTKTGKIVIEISLLEDKEPDYTQLSIKVEDTGIGIPEYMIPKLFKPFVQVPNSYKQGSGLGLVICKQIVKLMNGDIKIEKSEIDSGTIVSFTIKVKKTHENITENLIIGSIKNKHILIVDDNPINRISIMRTCKKWGLLPIVCSDINEALEQSDTYDYYCGLIDIVMPEHSGVWLAKRLIHEKKIKYPLIGLSSLKEINKESEELFIHYLIKPVQEQVLHDLIINIHKDNEFKITDRKVICSKEIKVLVVDDIHYNRKIIEKFLIKYGINDDCIDNAENGQEVIDKVSINNYDIVFLDIKMPIMSGIDAYNIIKSKNLKKDTKYIAVTAYMSEKENYYSEKHHFDYTFFKPISYTLIDEYLKEYEKENL